MHARHTHMQRVRVRECAASHQRGHDRNSSLLGELDQLLGSISLNDATTDVEHRTLGSSNHLSGFVNLTLVRSRHRTVARQFNLRRPGEVNHRILEVLRDINQNRAWTPRRSQVECLGERARDVLSFGDHEVVLSNRHGHTADVSFLESVGTQQRATDLTGNSDNRNRVHLSIRERGHQVSSTRAGSRDTDTDFAGNLRVTSGSVASSLLVAHEHMAELFRVINRIVERKHCTTGNAEGYLNTKLFKGSDNGLCTRNSLGGAGARLSCELGGRWGVLLVRVHDFAPGSWWATTQLTFTRRSYECGVGYNHNVHIVRSQSRQLDAPPV